MKRPFVLALAALFAVTGCTKVSSTSSDGARHAYTIPHVLRYATAEDITGLNPDLVQQTVVSYLAALTMAWLVKTDAHNRATPELATEIPTQANGGISRDGLTITYHLRHGVTWSDGAPFTADDVIFSFQTVLNPQTNVVSRDGFDAITKMEEPDKYTVVVHLKRKVAGFEFGFFSTAGANPCVLPKHLLGNLPNINHAAYNALPIGIGPFKYLEWKRSDSVTLVANPRYFRGTPKLQKIVFKIVPDRNTVLTQLEDHELDLWMPVSASYYDRIKAMSGVTLLKQPGYYFGHLDLQNQHPALSDVRVRRALRLAIDRNELKEKIRHGIGAVQDNPVSSVNPAYNPKVPTVPFDLAAAAKLLDEAGWTMGPQGVRVKNGQSLNFTFASSTGTPDVDQQLELIRANWQKIGVAFTVRRYPSPLFFAPYSAGGIVYGGKWDMVVFNWGGDPLGDLSSLYECSMIPPNGQNDPRYCNPAVSRAMEAFKQEYDPAKRQKYADFIQAQIAADAPIIVLEIVDDLFAYNSDLKNFHPNQLSPTDDFLDVDI